MTAPRRYAGRPGVPGIALGRLLRVDPRPDSPDEAPIAAGPAEVTAAFEAVAVQMAARAVALRADGHDALADIAGATALIARDPDLLDATRAAVESGELADRAVTAVAGRHADMLAALPDPTLAARATDVRQVGRRVVEHLRGPRPSSRASIGGVAEPTGDGTAEGEWILVADELGADHLLDPPANVVGAVSRLGGPAAHVAIVARALGIPLVFDIDIDIDVSVVTRAEPAGPAGGAAGGVLAVLDGAAGELTVDPDPILREAARAAVARVRERRAVLARDRTLPAVTRDGHAITLLANVSTPGEAAAALAAGAEGAGLVRTELPFLAARDWPTEAEHRASLAPILAPLAGRVVTVRTLDFAPDKLPPFLSGVAMTHRGLEMMLISPDAFAAQMRAVIIAGAGTRLRIMIPMVASVDQLRRCRELLAKAAAACGMAAPPLGAMIEVPEAVESIDAVAAEADFLSIGTNDLTAALLGLDRRDPALYPGRATEPVVLRAITAVAAAGRRHARPVSVCGDAAADPAVVPHLLASGVTALSVPPAALDEVRAAIRSTETDAVWTH